MRTFPALVLTVVVLTTAASAQPAVGRLEAGASLDGALTESAPLLADSSHAHVYEVESGGGPFEVRLTSAAFDPYLILRSPSGAQYDNDDWEGALDEARVVVGPDAAEAGTWAVWVNTYAPRTTGPYRLAHRTLDEAEAGSLAAAQAAREAEGTLMRAASLAGQAVVLYNEGRPAEAEPLEQEVLALRERVLGPDHPEVAQALYNLALTFRALDRLGEARPLLERAVAIRQAAGLASEAAEAQMALAGVLYALEDHAAARDLFEEVLRDTEQALGPESEAVAGVLDGLGLAEDALGRTAEARAALERSLAIREAALGPDDLAVARTARHLAAVLGHAEAYAEARTLVGRALAITERALGPDHPEAAALASDLGDLTQYEAFAAAAALYARALAVQDTRLGADHPDAVRTRNSLARVEAAHTDLHAHAAPVQSRGPDVAKGSEREGPLRRSGRDHAILFATDDYDDPGFADLVNPVADAEALARELSGRYGFTVEVVRNPTRAEVLRTLAEASRASAPDDGQVFVFFAGHGTYIGDDEQGRGYVVPRDGRPAESWTWISYAALAEELDALPHHRVLLVLDVCYGGSFVKRYRGADDLYARSSPEEILARYAPYKARLVLTSGAREYVSDGQAGQHSPFAFHLLRALRSPGGLNADGLLLFDELVGFAQETTEQTPLAGGFGGNAPGSTFFFLAEPTASAGN